MSVTHRSELTSMLQPLYDLLPLTAASSAVTEILSESIFKFGKGTKLLTEPLMAWMNGPGQNLMDGQGGQTYHT